MEKYLNTSGYDLYEIGLDEWIIDVKGGSLFAGSFKQVVKHAVLNMGFEFSEIEAAIHEMTKKKHNGAHFGMRRTFIFTFQKDFKNAQAS